MKSFKDKIIVITGASAGVGRATAWEFARQGAKIALLAREPLQLDGTRREVEQLGGKALTIVTDVADAAQVEKAAAQVERELGPIDLLAAIGGIASLGLVCLRSFQRQ